MLKNDDACRVTSLRRGLLAEFSSIPSISGVWDEGLTPAQDKSAEHLYNSARQTEPNLSFRDACCECIITALFLIYLGTR